MLAARLRRLHASRGARPRIGGSGGHPVPFDVISSTKEINNKMEIGPKRKRRLLMVVAALTTLAALATLVAGVTLGLFSSTVSSGDNTITAGTVTVGLDPGGTQVTCAVTGGVPGDSST